MKFTTKKTLILVQAMVVSVASMIEIALMRNDKNAAISNVTGVSLSELYNGDRTRDGVTAMQDAGFFSANGNSATSNMTITSLSELYGDEARAKEDIAVMQEAGLLDANGKMVDLDLRENGKRVELSALVTRIANGENIGAITVNGNAATKEQVVKISQVSAAIEVAELLNKKIDVTDKHVENLETLLTGIQNGTIDMQNTLKKGALKLNSPKSLGNSVLRGTGNDAQETIQKSDLPEGVSYNLPDTALDDLHLLDLGDNGESYIAPYFNNNGFDATHAFAFPDQSLQYKEYYYIDRMHQGHTNEGKIESLTTTEGFNNYIDWDNATWGVGSQDGTPVATVILPLSKEKTTEVQQWIANTTLRDCTTNNVGIELPLPQPYGTVVVKHYMPNIYFSNSPVEERYLNPPPYTEDKWTYDTARIRYPAYVVTEGDNENPIALATCFAVSPNFSSLIRRDVLNVYVDESNIYWNPSRIGRPNVNNEGDYPYVPEWNATRLVGWYYTDENGVDHCEADPDFEAWYDEWLNNHPDNPPSRRIYTSYERKVDALGYSYFDFSFVYVGDLTSSGDKVPQAPRLTTKEFPYFVAPSILLDKTKYIERTAAYEQANGGFITLTNPDNPDFPYLYPGDPNNPSNQYDLELLVTEDLYQVLAGDGIIYRQEDLDLRFSWQFSNRAEFSFKEVSFSSFVNWFLKYELNNDNEVSLTPTSTSETRRSIGVTATNGGLKSYDVTFPTTVISRDGFQPFLIIPRTSRTIEILAGLDADVLFSSNIAQATNQNTPFNISLYEIGDTEIDLFDPTGKTPVYTDTKTSMVEHPLSHISIPGKQLETLGNYAVVISASAGATTLSAKALLKVKQAPAKVSLNQLDSYYVTLNNIPDIKYTLTSALDTAEVKYTVQQAGSNAINESAGFASGGTISLNNIEFEGLKTTYTITVYARNSAEDPWSVDSMLLTVYNDDVLKILIRDVALGDIGGSTGGVVGDGTEVATGTINIDNSSKIDDLVDDSGEGAGYQISNYDFDQLRADVGLQRVISANYGTGTWGVISDKMNWYASNADGTESEAVTINYKENGGYADLRNYSYTSYIPTSDFLVVASDDVSADAPVTITVTHAATGIKKSIDVTVNTLHDKLYLFRFLPKTTTYVYYTNGNGEKRELHTNENGELAVYEPSGINSDVLTMSEKNGETYVGTYFKRNLVSGEKNIVRLEIYPCNNLTLAPISSQVLTILKPDGTPYSGDVTLRAGVYKGGEYCSYIGVRVTKDEGNQFLRDDIPLTASNGNVTLYYDPTQLTSDNGLALGLKYVYEYRIEGYQPGYIIADPMSNTPNDFVINLQNIRGGATTPQLIRQEYQQYLNGSTPTSYVRNVIDYKENIGISTNFPRAVLYTDIALPGEVVGTDENGYSAYEGEDVVKFAFYTTDGKKLTGQTDLSSGNVQAMQITNLNDLDTATYFVFPFSAVPMLRSTYVMTDDNLKLDGITDEEVSKRTARIKAVFNRGEMTVASINMPFGITNISHQDGLTTNTGAIRTEINNNLKEQMNIGEIFHTINVNDMIEQGFVFLSNLSGAGDDTPISMMILPTADPATFRIIAFVGSNARDSGGDEDGLSFNTDDLAEDISNYMKELKEDDKKKDNESNGEGSIKFNFYGTIILEARIGVEDGKWDIMFRGGSVGTNVKGKYEWGKTFMCGPYPAFINFELGFNADLEVAFGNKGTARAMLLDAALGVSIEAFAGLGFDLSIVALQLGIYGQIGADVNFLLLTPSDESVKTGTKLTISGEIGIKLKVKLLFISYTQKFASTGFNWTKKWGQYDVIKNYWTDQGYGQLFGKTRSGRSYQMLLFADGSAMVAIDGGPEMESRDYLELEERVWSSGANSGMALRKGPMTNALTNVLTNAYPYSHPAFTDDGEMFLYVSDNDNANAVESVVSYAVKNGDGYENQERVDTSSNNVLADLDVVASGTKTNAFAAWVKQVESPKRADTDAEISNDELGMMFNATEIYTSYYNGTKWTTTRLTDNYVADMSPTVASYGSRAIVAWRSMNASSMTSSDGDITTMFDVENNINYSIYNGTEWTTAQVAYNGTAGTVNAIDSAMLSDGTAIIVYTVRTGKDISTTETFYTVVGADGSILTTGRLTNDNNIDTNAQATAVNEDGGYFILGWYSEHDAGKGSTVAHDIRLARINANGNYDIDFPECVGLEDAGITSDFHFSVPANNTKMTNVAIVWSQRMDSNIEEDAGKYELNAVRFLKLNGLTGFTAPTNIAETTKNYTIDHFDAYTDTDGAVHAIILGSDYSNIEGIDVYDTIDLNAAANIEYNNTDVPNNLDILDGEAISSLKLAKGTFPETAAEVTADINISEVIPGFTTPVQFTVTNTGTNIINTVSATVGDENKEFTNLNLLPGKSTSLLMTYSVPVGALSDIAYSLTSNLIELGSGTLVLNRPDVGISGMKIIREENGERDIQVVLNNSFAIPLEGSEKTVKLAFYKDPFHETRIGDEITISPENYAEIDAGVYNYIQTFDVKDIVTLNSDGEIPANGFTVYARAWVENTKEPNIYNNDSYVSFTGPLARKGVQTITNDTTLEVNTNDQSEVTGYTVYTDIRNNSMNEKNIGIPVALLLDDKGNIIAQKNFQKDSVTIMSSMTLTAEQTVNLSVTFTVDELNGKTPVEAALGNVYTVTFDVNGGTGTFDSVQTDLEGKIALPGNNPTPPAVQEDEEPLFFKGWFTDATDGELITEENVFTADTTIYAHYVNHVHEFTYSKDGTTIIVTCADTDGFCYLPIDPQTNIHTATLTIAAPEGGIIYDGNAHPAILTYEYRIKGDAKVLYALKGEGDTYGEAVETEPTNVGVYRASITLGSGDNAVTVSVEYEIKNATLTSVSVSQNGSLTYNGNAQTPQVNTAATAVNNQAVTFTYSLTENGEYGAMPTFTNVADACTVYFKVSAPNHNVASGSFEVTMNKADRPAPVAPILDTATAKTIILTEVEGCEYKIDGGTWQDSTMFNDLAINTQYTFYQRYKETANYNASPISAPAVISTGAHDHEWSYTAEGATITATCSNTDGGHTGELSATMTIVAPTLSVYGGTGSAEATVINNVDGVNTPSIIYKRGETILNAAPIDAGTYTANITVNDVTATVEYTIAKKVLTITANPNTITYGDAPTNDDVSFNGFVNNEDESVLSGTLDYDYSYVQYDHVSDTTHTYTITPKGLTSDNYDITFVPGVLTVNPKAITVTIVNKSSVYGEAQVTLEATTEDGAIVNDDTEVYSLACTVNEQSNVGSYDIIGSDLSDNYDVTFVGEQNAYSVTKKALTVTANPKTITYGDAPTNDDVSFNGFVNNEDRSVLGGELAFAYNYEQYGHVSDTTHTYTITPLGYTSGNYEITFVPGVLTVERKVLTITANPNTITYGDAPTNDDVSFNGFVNNEDESVLSGTLDYDYSYVQYDHVSDTTHTYTITPKGLTSDNYDITFVPGVLTVNPKAITVTIVSKSSVYGEAQVTLEATTEDGAIVNGDTEVYSLACTVNEQSNVGSYDIIGIDLSDNYDITFVGEQNAYVVTKRPITVTIVSKSSVYGEAQVTLEATTEDGAIVNDDTDVYSLSCTVNELSNVGSYHIIGSDLSDNYDITFVGEQNAYVVTKRPITVTAEDKTIKYGQDFPTYTFMVSEEISADVLAELKQKTVFSCDGDKSVPGKYDIVLSFVDGHTEDTALTNYKVTLEDAYLYVLSKSLVDPTSPETSAVEIRLENNEEAFDFNISVKVGIVTTTETTESTIDFDKVSSQYVDRRSEISKVYSITLYRTEIVDGVEKMVEIQPSDLKEGLNLIIKIEIPEYLVGRNFRILHIHSQSDIEYVDASNLQIEDGYVYVKINRLSDFAFVNLKASEEMNHGGFCLGWLTLIFDILLAAYFVVYMILKRKKLLGIIGLGASGAVTIFAVIVLILHICYESIIGLVLSVLLLILFLVFFLLFKKGNKPEENKLAASLEDNGSMAKKESENKLDEPIEENSLKAEETINEPVEPTEEEEVVTITDEKGNIFEIRYIKSFTAKLSQTSEEVKDYYNELKNYVLAYKGVHSRVSWHFDSINIGRDQLLKFSIRGKTLCLYYALNYEKLDSKYKVEKAEAIKYQAVPCLYRIKNDRRFNYAKELIDQLMDRINVIKGKESNEDFSIPYEETKVLLSKGLIKEVKVQVNKPNETIIETKEDEEGNEVVISQDNKGNIYETRYVKSFLARLYQASDETKSYYKEIRNYILSYKGIDESISWLYDSINLNREQLIKLNIKSKALHIYLALDTSKIGKKYQVEASEAKKYSKVSCSLVVTSETKLKYAKELIERIMKKHKLVLGELHQEEYGLTYLDRDTLIKKGLIKEIKIKK